MKHQTIIIVKFSSTLTVRNSNLNYLFNKENTKSICLYIQMKKLLVKNWTIQKFKKRKLEQVNVWWFSL